MRPLRRNEAGDVATPAAPSWLEETTATEKAGDKTVKPGIGNGKRRTEKHVCEWRKNGSSPSRKEIHLRCWICERTRWQPIPEVAPASQTKGAASPGREQPEVTKKCHGRHVWRMGSRDSTGRFRRLVCMNCGYTYYLPEAKREAADTQHHTDGDVYGLDELERVCRKYDVRCEAGLYV